VSSARVTPKNVIAGPRSPATVALAVGDTVRVGVLICVDVGVALREGVGVAELSGEGVRVGVSVGVYVRVAVAEGDMAAAVRVGDAVTDGGGVALRVAVAARVGVLLGVVVALGTGVGESDACPVGVRVGDGVAVELGTATVVVCVGDGVTDRVVGLGVPLRARVPVLVGVVVGSGRVGDGLGIVAVGVGVNDGTVVGVAVCGVAVCGVAVAGAVGLAVNVNGGPLVPTRRIIWSIGPRLPVVSRRRTVSTVSPLGKSSVRGTGRQNCACVPTPRKCGCPNASCVHGEPPDAGSK
jgi:hypothetical protein